MIDILSTCSAPAGHLPQNFMNPPTYFPVGNSVLGHEIGYYIFESASHVPAFASARSDNKRVLILSGLHGEEIEGVILVSALMRRFSVADTISDENHNLNSLSSLIAKGNKILVIPLLNPDGFFLKQRWNFNLVDLNRNFPTSDWQSTALNPRYSPGKTAASEPETQAFIKVVNEFKPHLILDFHSYTTSSILPSFTVSSLKDMPSLEKLTHKWAQEAELTIDHESLSYPTTGGKHTWCYEKNIPEITVELLRGLSASEIVSKYLTATTNFIINFCNTLN